MAETGWLRSRRTTTGFVKPGHIIQRYADRNVSVVDKFVPFKMVVGGAINNPSSFFLVPVEFWKGDLRVKIQEEYNEERRKAWKIFGEKEVSVGMYVALLFDDEWHRGRILSINNGGKKPFLVRLIDFGEAVQVALSQLYHLSVSCGEDYEAAAECQLVFPRRTGPLPRPGIIRKSWERIQRRAFKRIMFDREVEVTVLNKIVNDYGETVWQVTLNITGCANEKETLFRFTPLTPTDILRKLDDALWSGMKITHDQ